jgi:uncharacterized membrane protein YgdD (TMEM256/DUF423 family)
MESRKWIGIGAVLSFLSVALGAFGAHALKEVLSERSAATYQTAVHYQLYHALALIVFGIWAAQFPDSYRPWPAWSFVLGVILFSGSLYGLAFTGIREFGYLTPFGGVSFLVGWIMFAFLAWRA